MPAERSLSAAMRRAALSGCLLLGACATGTDRAPQSAEQAWQAPPAPQAWRKLAVAGPITAETPVVTDQEYGLAALIDLAQRTNPATRLAWNQARQAASAVGLAEATYLPQLSAGVITGRIGLNRRYPEILGYQPKAESSVSGTAPLITLQWLLFDFGMRTAANQAAQNLSLGANYLFNAAHQKLIYDVSRNYYEYGAARERSRISAGMLDNSKDVLKAVMEKRKSGLATTVEEAQARQLVAQAQLQVTRSKGQERNAYQALLDHLSLGPGVKLRIADSTAAPLPPRKELPSTTVLQEALADRPDVMASIAALKAAEDSVGVADADFLPKVFVAGFYMGNHNDLSIGPVSGVASNGATRGVLLGVSMPIYDGGMRRSRLHDAKARVQAAQAGLEKLRNTAMSEIVYASNMLDTSLESYEAATSLVATSLLTYDAAVDAYRLGLGTVTVATEAANGLLTARLARNDAHAASQVAAITLAFALGALDSVPPAIK